MTCQERESMSELEKTAKVEFWIHDESRLFALRRMRYVPRKGDFCVFKGVLRPVVSVVWCLDEDATELGVKVQVTLGENESYTER